MKILNDTLKGREFYEFLLAAMKNIYQHLVDGGALYLFHSDAEKVNFYNAVVDAGFSLFDDMRMGQKFPGHWPDGLSDAARTRAIRFQGYSTS